MATNSGLQWGSVQHILPLGKDEYELQEKTQTCVEERTSSVYWQWIPLADSYPLTDFGGDCFCNRGGDLGNGRTAELLGLAFHPTSFAN